MVYKAPHDFIHETAVLLNTDRECKESIVRSTNNIKKQGLPPTSPFQRADKILNVEAQLAALRIPVFEYPWSGGYVPDVVQVENQMIQWAEEYGLLVSDSYCRRVAHARYAWLAARC